MLAFKNIKPGQKRDSISPKFTSVSQVWWDLWHIIGAQCISWIARLNLKVGSVPFSKGFPLDTGHSLLESFINYLLN